MKRDWDTIREVLTQLEDLPSTDSTLAISDFPEDQAYAYSYHVELLIDAGLVEGQMSRTLGRGPTDFLLDGLLGGGTNCWTLLDLTPFGKRPRKLSRRGGSI